MTVWDQHGYPLDQPEQMDIDECIEVASTGSDGKPPVRKMRPIRSDATRTRQAKARTKAERDGQ